MTTPSWNPRSRRTRAPVLAALLLVGGAGSVPAPVAAQSGPTGALPTARPGAPSPPPGWARDVALFAGLLGFDASVRGLAREIRVSGAADQPAGIAEYFGDWQAVLPVYALGSAVVGGVTEGSTGLGKALAVLGGIAAGSMANEALNRAVGRHRPLDGRGAFSFDPFHGHASFPSGHAAFAFSMAGGVDAATDHWFPAAVAYTLAGATAASRVHDGKHWVSDAVVGSVLGAVVSRWTTRRIMGVLGIRTAGVDRNSGNGGLVRRPEGAAPRAGFLDRVRPVATAHFLGVSVRF